jgi:putative peptidoglycan lipid II flippase
VPAARLFAAGDGVGQLALAFAAFAPGLVGYGLATHLSRVLLARGRSRVAAAGLVTGWLLVIVADVVAVWLVPSRWVVPALGIGNTIGLTVSGLALLAAVRRDRGGAALRGVARAAGASVAGAVAGGVVGALVGWALPVAGFLLNACVALLAGGCAVVVFGLVALALDGGDLRPLLARLRRWAAAR